MEAKSHDDQETGLTYIIICNKALYYGIKLDHSLINPSHIRSYPVDFRDHIFDRERGIIVDVNDKLKIPMHSSGTKVQFTARMPTETGLQYFARIIMTIPLPWNPNEVVLGKDVRGPMESIPQSCIYHNLKIGTIRHCEYIEPMSDESLLQ